MHKDMKAVGEAQGLHRWSDSGFTLVEMLISSFLFLIIMAGVLALFNSQAKVSRQTNQRTDLLANARAAMDMITKDLRTAGATMPAAAVYRFVNGDAPDGSGNPNGVVNAGTDVPAQYPDYIEFMASSGQGSPCVFSLSETMNPATLMTYGVDATAPPAVGTPPACGTPEACLIAYMTECANSYRMNASSSDLWVIESRDGNLYSVITATGAPPYAGTGAGQVRVIPGGASTSVNLPGGLAGSTANRAAYDGGRIRLANDFRHVAYRIGRQNTDHPVLQRAEANQSDSTIDPTDWQNVAENVEDLQIAIAYLDPAGDPSNLMGKLETSGGVAPFFRTALTSPPVVSHDLPTSANPTPEFARYFRVTLVVRTDQVDQSRIGSQFNESSLALSDVGEPLFYARPSIEDRTGFLTSDGRARVVLQEVVDIRNRNLPAM